MPTLSEIYQRIITDIINSCNIDSDTSKHIDPSLRNNPEGAFAYALAQESDSLHKLLERIKLNLDPNTAEEEFLPRLGNFKKITRNPATTGNGYVTFIGNTGISIPSGTNITKTDGSIYETQSSMITTTQTIGVSSLIRSGSTATATTSSNHTLAVGMEITIAGTVEVEYNGTFVIVSIPASNQFTYTVSGTPSTPATGTIIASYEGGYVLVESVNTGQDVNIDSSGQLILSTPITGIDNTIYVQFDGITGGSNQEDTESFRARIVYAWQNPVALFNTIAIELKAKEITGVTRVWVKEITPAEGQVTVYFVRDNDSSIIPDAGEVATVKNKILEIKQAVTSDTDVIVTAPTPVNIPITFSALSPNTTEMQTAITNSLSEFFTSENEVGVNVPKIKLESIIFNTIDDTGVQPSSFTLTAPAGDTTINANEIGILGTITYP